MYFASGWRRVAHFELMTLSSSAKSNRDHEKAVLIAFSGI